MPVNLLRLYIAFRKSNNQMIMYDNNLLIAYDPELLNIPNTVMPFLQSFSCLVL